MHLYIASNQPGGNMACSTMENKNILETSKPFPSVTDGRINVVKFLEASTDLVGIVERLGSVFAPVKYDMQGNINKIVKNYKYDDNSCLLELMLEEVASGKKLVAEAILWLNRALLFFELAFLETLKHLKDNNIGVNMKNIFTVAYEGSVKQYHNWVTQQVFTFICKMSPTLPQVMKSMGADDNLKAFEMSMETYNICLHLVRTKIDDFFRLHKVFT